MLGASAALALAGVPFGGPIAGARVGYIDGRYVLNPVKSQMEKSQMDLIVAGTATAVLMVESEIKCLPEDVVLEAVMFGHGHFQIAIDAIKELTAQCGKPAWNWKAPPVDSDLRKAVEERAGKPLAEVYRIREKQQRTNRLAELKAEIVAGIAVGEKPRWNADQVGEEFSALESRIVRQRVINGEPRIDGRDYTTVRPITIRTGRASADSRFCALHSWGNPGARGHDARH